MPKSQNDPRRVFFKYWEKYYGAKQANQPKDSLLPLAINCRDKLQKIAGSDDPMREAETMQSIFAGFATKKAVAELYPELCDDSTSYKAI
jgi:hypothetical protein